MNRNGPQLALSASAGGCDVAIRVDGRILQPATAPSRKTEDLAPRLQELLQQADANINDTTCIYLDLGPGSYTGLRVAVTFARTLLSFVPLTVKTTTSLEMMAVAALSAETASIGTVVSPVVDARRNAFHHARIEVGETSKVLRTPAAEPLPEVLTQLQAGDLVLAEQTLHSLLADTCAERGCPLITPTGFRAALLFDSRLQTRETKAEDLDPLYLMGSYAE